MEPSLSRQAAGDGLPEGLALRCPSALICDRRRWLLDIVYEGADVARVRSLWTALAAAEAAPRPAASTLPAVWREDRPADYLAAVAQAREYIRAGDVFQANLARGGHGRLVDPQSPAEVYATPREANPTPFSTLFQWRGAALSCSSPERLLSLASGRASRRPIAGTNCSAIPRNALSTSRISTWCATTSAGSAEPDRSA